MPLYEGKVKTRGNSLKRVEVQARNASEAQAHISKSGRVISMKRKLSMDVSRGMTDAERQILFNRLAAMLGSRVGTSTALALLRDTFTGKIQEVSARLLAAVESGKDLAEAMEQVGAPDFPEATVALIKAGSRSGETWRAVKDAAVFEYELANIRKSASKGLASGIFGFLMAGGLTLGSTLWVGPAIMESPLIKGAGNVNIDWINTAAFIVACIMGVIMFLGIGFWLLASVGRRVMPVAADKVILKIPFYKDLVLSRNNFIVLYGLALLIKSGVRTEEALRLSAQTAPRGALRVDLQMAAQAVKTGRDWPKAMGTLHPTDKAALMSATDREQVASTLDNLAAQYRELYGQRLASFVPMLNLMAALFLSIAGGLLFGQSILPMLMASEGMLGNL
ncbi:type IV pilin biogenesis protein [compost metagenome]